MSSDPENEFFSDGLTEELINLLTYVPGLRVVARTSVFCFKNVVKDIREIGSQLNVQTVLEGSVRKAGNQLRVTAQLIDVSTGYHLFSRTFPREFRDVFAVQEELAGAVVSEITPQMSADASPVPQSTPSLEAYTLYLKAKSVMTTRFHGPRECIDMFQEVLALDPDYAPAWAALANAYCLQVWFGMMSAKTAMPLARHSSLKALEADDTNGLAHATLGLSQTMFDWDWAGAEQSFQRAIKAQPGLSGAHQLYGFTCLMPQLRIEEGLAEIDRALVLNPICPILSGSALHSYAAAGRHDLALRQHSLIRPICPNHPVTYGGMGLSYELQGRYDEAVAMYNKGVELSHRTYYPLACLGHLLARTGAPEKAREILGELLEKLQANYGPALVHLGLGNMNEAVRWLDRAMDEREPHVLTMLFDPRFAPLRAHPSGQQLLARMGLAPAAIV
jgi:adenylate cyclase